VRRPWAWTLLPAALASLPACHRAGPSDVQGSAVVTVEVARAEKGDLVAWISASGLVTPVPDGDVTITAPGPARIESLPFAVGDRVPRGAVVARFDVPALRADLASRESARAQAAARLSNARANQERMSSLLARGIASRKQEEDAARELREAEAGLQEAQATRSAAADVLSRSRPTAPFNAVVAERWHGAADLVDANEHVLRLVDPTRLQVTVAVAAADVPHLHVGHEAHVHAPGAPADEVTPGKLVSGAGAVDPATGLAPARVSLGKVLAAGTPVKVEIAGEQRGGVVLVPKEALVTDGEETVVYVLQPPDHAKRRPVRVGLQGADEVEIVSGLAEGETVLVKGQEELPDGAQVKVEAAKPEGAP